MNRKSEKAGWNAKERLQAILRTEPWFVLAAIYLLTAEQWKALVSGEALGQLQETILRMARRTHKNSHGGIVAGAEDAAQDVQLWLATHDLLEGYDPERAAPRAYLLGAAWRRLLDRRRSLWRVLRHEQALTVEPAVMNHADQDAADEQADKLAEVLALIEKLPAKKRDAIKKRYLADGASRERGNPAEYRARHRGLENIRKKMQRRGGEQK